MKLSKLNDLTEKQFNDILLNCCTAVRWVEKLSNDRPFSNKEDLYQKANKAWQDLSEEDYLQAFEGHPKIGDVNSLRAKYAQTKSLASDEQSGMNSASEQIIAKLSEGNQIYHQKFGFIFIVCATGKSAEEMLALLQQRLSNERSQEIVNAAEEQRKIFQIRLKKLLD